MPSEIAIIIPCYNQGSFLLEALKSLEEFNNLNPEVIIVNDGSSDSETLLILDRLGKEGYQVIHQENGGVASARNRGIASVRAPFFIPLDADNLLYLPYLTEGVDWLKKNPNCAVVFGDARIFGEKEGTWCNHPIQPEEIAFENYIDNCALIRKSAWEKVGGYDTKVPIPTREDYILWLDLLREGYDFHYLNQFCFAYRYQENSKVRRSFRDPKNRVLIQEYIFKKQSGLIREFQQSGIISSRQALSILARHYLQLSYLQLGFGSIRRGYSYLLLAILHRGHWADILKHSVSWILRRYR